LIVIACDPREMCNTGYLILMSREIPVNFI